MEYRGNLKTSEIAKKTDRISFEYRFVVAGAHENRIFAAQDWCLSLPAGAALLNHIAVTTRAGSYPTDPKALRGAMEH